MKKTVISFVSIFVVTIVLVISCKKSKKLTPSCDGSKPTYNNGIKPIIDNNCMGSSCHVAGSPYGNFTTYNGLAPYLSGSNLFKRDVLDQQIMPKNNNLSQDDLNKIQCWADNGYPEN